MGRRLNFDYAMIHTFYWMFFGVGNAFASAFLLAAGYTNGEIGVILAAANVLAVFLQPLIADFADRTKKISLIGVVQLCTICLLVLEGALFIFQHKSTALWVIFALMTAWLTTLQPLLNSLAFKLEEAGVHINFGLCRSVGSLGYSLLCAVLGTLVEKQGVLVVPAAGELALAGLLAALLFADRRFQKACAAGKKNAQVLRQPLYKEDADEKINLLDFIRANKTFAFMQLGIAGVYFHNSILNNFMLQIVEDVGGTSEDMGRVLAVMAFLEMPALIFFDKLHQKVSCQTILKIAAVAFTFKVFLICLAKDITLIYAAHLLQTFSFGLFLPAIVAFTNEIMRKGEAIKGQACYTMMTTVSSILASIAGGFLLDSAGAKFMLLTATIVTAVGAAVVLLLIGRIGPKSETAAEDAKGTKAADEKNCA